MNVNFNLTVNRNFRITQKSTLNKPYQFRTKLKRTVPNRNILKVQY